MNKFLSAAWVDLRVLWRTGYIFGITAIFLLFFLILSLIPHIDFISFPDIISALMVLDEVIAPMLLVGLLLLYERGEHSMIALAVTPMRNITYIGAKLSVVTAICGVAGILLIMGVYDGQLNMLSLTGGLLGIAAISTLAGIITVAPFDTLYRFILPMIGMIIFLSIPGYGVLFGWQHNLIAFHPIAPPLALLEGAFTARPPGRLLYGAAGTLIWLAIGIALALHSYRQMQYRAAGG